MRQAVDKWAYPHLRVSALRAAKPTDFRRVAALKHNSEAKPNDSFPQSTGLSALPQRTGPFTMMLVLEQGLGRATETGKRGSPPSGEPPHPGTECGPCYGCAILPSVQTVRSTVESGRKGRRATLLRGLTCRRSAHPRGSE